MKDYLVKVRNVWKYYGDVPVLRNVSFNIKEHESIAMMGANGAGKTTLVESICGLTKITKGEIKYNLGEGNWRKKIGIQFQENIYPPGIKVKHLIDFYKDVYKKEKLQIDIEDLITRFDIRRLYKNSITSLSGGELQRVNILLAIINNPKLVFFDEISTGLDIQAKLKLVQLIKYLKRKHKWTILVITHNIEDIIALCDRVIVLSRGKKEYDGKVVDIMHKYGSLENFISEEVKTTLIEKQIETKKETFFSKYFGGKNKDSDEDDLEIDIDLDDSQLFFREKSRVKGINTKSQSARKKPLKNVKYADENDWIHIKRSRSRRSTKRDDLSNKRKTKKTRFNSSKKKYNEELRGGY